jgi:hypothetical protein
MERRGTDRYGEKVRKLGPEAESIEQVLDDREEQGNAGLTVEVLRARTR